jgi:hypothetical protein
VGYLLDSNDVITEAEKSPQLETIARKWLMKSQQVGNRLSGCCGDL